METIRTIIGAYIDGEKYTLARGMISLLGDALEGFDEKARKQFNTIWSWLYDYQKQIVIDHCPWESVANSLAEKNGLEKPYRKIGEFKWERIREDPASFSDKFEELCNFISYYTK